MLWRQGDFVDPRDFAAIDIKGADSTRALVISHSCDLAGDDEEFAEILIGEVTEHQQHANGHSVRLLDLKAASSAKQEIVRFNITNRRQIDKSRLHSLVPDASRMSVSELSILKRWLAQRYSRPEFPDAFVERMKKCDGFEKWAKKHSMVLSGVYFGTEDLEITDEQTPYELRIYLVFASCNAEHRSKANSAREELVELLKRHYWQAVSWFLIELVGCEVVSDADFSVRNASIYKRWRFEHRSIKGEPLDRLD
jgi:hypothetical protein